MAFEPPERTALREAGEPPETYPTGLWGPNTATAVTEAGADAPQRYSVTG
jgi:hypothetical protein